MLDPIFVQRHVKTCERWGCVGADGENIKGSSAIREVYVRVVRSQEIDYNSIFELNFATYGEYAELNVSL